MKMGNPTLILLGQRLVVDVRVTDKYVVQGAFNSTGLIVWTAVRTAGG
jgi:hypothetical protein